MGRWNQERFKRDKRGRIAALSQRCKQGNCRARGRWCHLAGGDARAESVSPLRYGLRLLVCWRAGCAFGAGASYKGCRRRRCAHRGKDAAWAAGQIRQSRLAFVANRLGACGSGLAEKGLGFVKPRFFAGAVFFAAFFQQRVQLLQQLALRLGQFHGGFDLNVAIQIARAG